MRWKQLLVKLSFQFCIYLVWIFFIALEKLGLDDPAVPFHDRDRAEMSALEVIFPNSPTMPCIWYMNTDVEVHTMENHVKEPINSHWWSLESGRAFIDLCCRWIDAKSEVEFD